MKLSRSFPNLGASETLGVQALLPGDSQLLRGETEARLYLEADALAFLIIWAVALERKAIGPSEMTLIFQLHVAFKNEVCSGAGRTRLPPGVQVY